MDIQATDIKVGQMFPNLILEDERGRTVRIQSYRQRKNLVLVFSGEPITSKFQQMLEAITKRFSDFEFDKAKVLAILAGSRRDLAKLKAGQDYPFQLLVDVGGEAHREAGAIDASGRPEFTVVVMDRYCEVYALYRVDANTPRPAVQSLIEWLEYIELQCDE
jgi:peroxiredoxin